jgi:NTP pyrophosphatase (non-canonical NTP hydrolase)
MVKKEILEKLLIFRDQRDWKQFHNPKNLASSIVIEASELMEVFQWVESSKSEECAKKNIQRVSDEIADIMVYILYFCNDLGIDIDKALEDKIATNDKRYPADKAKGNSKKYTEF